jgi:hypothetical protein
MLKRILILLFFMSSFLHGQAQHAYRLKADILTKTRLPDSTFQVSKGVIHYDKNIKKIIFDFSFPDKEKVVLFDTLMFRYRDGKLLEKTSSFLIPDQSFFHFILNGNLSNYGFDQANFTAKGSEKKKDLVITTWLPPDHIKKYVSKVLVATRNKQLYSITMMGPEEKVLNRQILKEYRLVNGQMIPHEVLMATYLDEQVMYQVITLDHVILNEEDNHQHYNHAL